MTDSTPTAAQLRAIRSIQNYGTPSPAMTRRLVKLGLVKLHKGLPVLSSSAYLALSADRIS